MVVMAPPAKKPKQPISWRIDRAIRDVFEDQCSGLKRHPGEMIAGLMLYFSKNSRRLESECIDLLIAWEKGSISARDFIEAVLQEDEKSDCAPSAKTFEPKIKNMDDGTTEPVFPESQPGRSSKKPRQ